jgi:hypothetical protein
MLVAVRPNRFSIGSSFQISREVQRKNENENIHSSLELGSFVGTCPPRRLRQKGKR